tara:strand:- start:2761 stop:4419 length:1659 start_codon:yes stop_codon:yes gene_type:complete
MQKKFYFFDSDALKNFHKRVFFSITIFIFVYLIAFYRIIDIMIIDKNQNFIKHLKPIIERGNIYDRNNNLLSATIKSNALSARPKDIKNKLILSKKLSSIISMPEEEILDLLNKNKDFVWIKRNISPKEHQLIINIGEVGLQTQHKQDEELYRIYPYRNTASHVIGYINTDGIGQSGIERGLNNTLSQGNDVYLSIDINLQQAIRNELLYTLKKFSADSGFTTILDIETGEILAMNSLPDFNPNDRKTLIDKNIFNQAIEGNYEMGSVIKPITIAMGVDKGIINPDMVFDVSKPISGIKDFKPHNGKYNVKEIIVNSSNIGTAQIANKIGKKNQINFFKKIGFFDKINTEIFETALPLGNKNNWGDHETMRIGYGYAFSITPLHLVMAYASLSNQGKKVYPTFLKDNKIFKNSELIQDFTSSYFNKLLRAVILETKVTGKKVKIEGYEIGGKTGTANLLNKFGNYEEGKNLTSFIAVFPISQPKYVVLASIANPKKDSEMQYKLTGATVAAPLVKKIIKRMIEILDIAPMNMKEILKADISSNYKSISNVTF